MVGYFYINSIKMERNELTGEFQTEFNIYIQYDDGQFIKTDLVVPKQIAFFKDAFETAKQYFKGELKRMS